MQTLPRIKARGETEDIIAGNNFTEKGDIYLWSESRFGQGSKFHFTIQAKPTTIEFAEVRKPCNHPNADTLTQDIDIGSLAE